MDIGASIFFTDYSITPADRAVALEERGFDYGMARPSCGDLAKIADLCER